MRRPALLALALGAAPAVAGCGDVRALPRAALAALGRASLGLVDADEAARLARAGGEVLQARGDGDTTRSLPGALPVPDGEALARAPAGRRFVVVSVDEERALRLGARLAREGAARVDVVPYGLPAWHAPVASPATREE